MSAESVVELVVLALAVGAGILSLRPAPALDWEHLWKIILATVIRGEVEAGEGDKLPHRPYALTPRPHGIPTRIGTPQDIPKAVQ